MGNVTGSRGREKGRDPKTDAMRIGDVIRKEMGRPGRAGKEGCDAEMGRDTEWDVTQQRDVTPKGT